MELGRLLGKQRQHLIACHFFDQQRKTYLFFVQYCGLRPLLATSSLQLSCSRHAKLFTLVEALENDVFCALALHGENA